MAMALAKELTNHSLPEIGDAFGGRDHTTVLHACRKIEQLREESHDIKYRPDNPEGATHQLQLFGGILAQIAQ